MIKRYLRPIVILNLIGILISCKDLELPEPIQQAYENLPAKIDYNLHIKPILSDNCFICHGPDKAKVKANLQLHLPESAFSELEGSPGKYAIIPGNLKQSQLVHRILSNDPNIVMPEPESHLKLKDREKAMLIKWIDNGAEYKKHWAFIPPITPKLPKVKLKEKIANPIDHFVLAKLEDEDLQPNPRADKEILLRRLSFDLTGLPPNPLEIASFINDSTPDAYEKQVNRLLASPHYAEQMTLDWMDLSRYADTHGYTVDQYRDVSPYRDWVIKAFDENIPYDKFIQMQLAGDMMKKASKEQILATTFNRLHPQNQEGGIIDEEFRSEYVADRTNVLGEAFLGLTMACAKCHDHKYDPISQKNYYELYSFFNNVNEAGQISFDSSMPVPNILLPTPEQEEFIAYANALVEDKQKEIEKVFISESKSAIQWIQNERYRKLVPNALPTMLIAKVDFLKGSLNNSINSSEKGKMKRQHSPKQFPKIVDGYSGKGIEFDGDAWLDLDRIGVFKRNHTFSIGIRIYIPEELENGVIFHKNIGTRLYNYRGFHLALKEGKLEVMLAHFWPDNAIVELSHEKTPKDKWLQLTMTYDGSSRAKGLKIYMDGKELKTNIEVDNLYKDIIYKNDKEPGLQIGARWRGKGIGGAVVDDILVFTKELTALEVIQISDTRRFEMIINKSQSELTKPEREMLKNYYITNFSKKFKSSFSELANSRVIQVDSLEQVKEIMVMKEMKNPRKTFILNRGQYDQYGERVYPNVLENILKFPDSLEKNRLGLAKWVTSKSNPLTARVAVNRYWKNLFGTGIVKTVEDFGNQGEMPSHPELLDWLATQFIESGWDVKKLIKLIVMSNTYQQSSIASKALLKLDKMNRLLARGPSKRLSGEMLRNNILAASGLLNRKIGGRSVKPYQPKGLWKINTGTYKTDKGDNLYRRSMYTIWKRSVPHPTIATFDAPTRSFCSVRRQDTNTPLQALVMMNDPIYVEASRVLGYNMIGFDDPKAGISDVFKRLTGRSIKKEELNLLLDLRSSEYEKFKTREYKTKGWLNTGEFRILKYKNKAMVAANAIVASTIINSDATIIKR